MGCICCSTGCNARTCPTLVSQVGTSFSLYGRAYLDRGATRQLSLCFPVRTGKHLASNFPKTRGIGFGEVIGDRHLPGPNALGRFPCRSPHRPGTGKRPTAVCDRNRTAALPDAIEQSKALRLKLGYAHDLMLHAPN
jgi:hypothetical protein